MIILIQCRDSVGLVAAISGLLSGKKINILSMREYVDTESNHFFARVVLEQYYDPGILLDELTGVLPNDAQIKISVSPVKKIIVLVTKEYHCLSDLLLRNKFDEESF